MSQSNQNIKNISNKKNGLHIPLKKISGFQSSSKENISKKLDNAVLVDVHAENLVNNNLTANNEEKILEVTPPASVPGNYWEILITWIPSISLALYMSILSVFTTPEFLKSGQITAAFIGVLTVPIVLWKINKVNLKQYWAQMVCQMISMVIYILATNGLDASFNIGVIGPYLGVFIMLWTFLLPLFINPIPKEEKKSNGDSQ